MLLKTLSTAAAENEALTTPSRPASLKHWWKCSEATGATSLVDAVNGANITIGAITSSAGVITTVPNVSNAATAADLEDIGTNDFMFIFRGEVTNLGSVAIGNTSGNKVQIVGSLLTNSAVTGAGGTSTTDPSDNALATWALVRNSNDSGNIALYKDGAIVGTSDADASGAITLTGNFTFTSADNIAGVALFVFDDGLPTDFAKAAYWMGESWANNSKLVWPKW